MNRFNDEIKVEVESDKSAGGGGFGVFFHSVSSVS